MCLDISLSLAEIKTKPNGLVPGRADVIGGVDVAAKTSLASNVADEMKEPLR